MRVIVALSLAAAATAACESLAPAAPDPSRPSLFPGSQGPAAAVRPAASTQPDGSTPFVRTQLGSGLGSPYPSQQTVLDQQHRLLNQDIRRQETGRDQLQQQLQQGVERDRQDQQRLQQQIEQQRARP